MKKTTTLAATAMALMLAAPAYAAGCEDDLAELNQRISANEQNYRVVAGTGMSGDIRTLRDAARIFARNGQEEACQEVVASIRQMLDTRQQEMTTSQQMVDRDTWLQAEVERIKGAMPVSEMKQPLRAAELIGADVRNDSNNDLGEVEDVVFEPTSGRIQYAIVSHGGFLGMGEEQLAVPWEQFRITSEGDEPVLVLSMSEETLEKAPSFERGSWSDVDTEQWRQENERFYMEQRQQGQRQ